MQIGLILLGNAVRIFSGFITKIEYIRIRNGVTYLYTNLFEIEIEKAIKEDEIIIESKIEFSEKDEEILDSMEDSISSFRMGLLYEDPILSIERLIAKHILVELNYIHRTEWQNYYQSHVDQRWIKLR